MVRLLIIIPTRRSRRRSFDGHSKGWLREKRCRRKRGGGDSRGAMLLLAAVVVTSE